MKLKEELMSCKTEKMFNDIPLLDYIYIIPTRKKHDSGYNIMYIIGENNEGYKKILGLYTDVVNIEQLFLNRHNYYTISMDIPEYPIIRLFAINNIKFRVKVYGISSFGFDLIQGSDSNE